MITVNNKKAEKYIGFTDCEIRAVNPTRSELNKLLGRTDSDTDKELEYLSKDRDGNDRVKLTFWMWSDTVKKYFPQTITLVKKNKKSIDGTKEQYVNSVCFTCWTDVLENLPVWFTDFQKKGKTVGKKDIRKAYVGEEDLVNLMRNWVNAVWTDPKTYVMVDVDKLFNGDFSELQNLLDQAITNKFVSLLGVKTDSSDISKQYQYVYNGSYLPYSMWEGINNDLMFKNEYTRSLWEKFDNKVNNGQYGFDAYFQMVPIKEYDPGEDPAASESARVIVTPDNSNY